MIVSRSYPKRIIYLFIGFVSSPAIGILLALAPFVVFLAPTDDVIGAGDYTDFQLPAREYARGEILSGRCPLWIASLCCGTPLHASQQAALCYFPVTIAAVLLSANYGIKINIFLHVALCFWGQYKLARAYDISRLASTFAALVTCQSGFFVFHLLEGHVNLIVEYALIPWFFWSIVRMFRSPSATNAVLLASVTTLMSLGGQPQMLYYCCLVGALWALGSLLVGAASNHRGKFLGWGCCAIALAILMSAIQLLPTIELVRDGYESSERGTFNYAADDVYSARTTDCLTFWWPTYMGNHHAGAQEFVNWSFVHERTNYLGVATPLLLFLGLAKKTEQWQWPILCLIVFCLLIGLGPNTPIFKILGTLVPGLFSFRCPARILAIVAVLGSLLAARGLDSLVAGAPWEKGPRLIAAGTLCFIAFNLTIDSLLSLIAIPSYSEFVQHNLRQELILAVTLTVVLIVLVLMLPLVRRKSTTGAYYLILLFTAADLWATSARHIRLVPSLPFERLPNVRDGDPDIRFVEAPDFPAIRRLDLQYSNLVRLAVDRRWTSVMTREGGVLPRAVTRLHDDLVWNAVPALKAAACNWVCIDGEWQELPDSLSRARFVPDSAKELCSVSLSTITDKQIAQLIRSASACSIEIDNCETIEIVVRAPESGFVILADTFYPGWKCWSGGTQLDINPMNGVFRGVHVSAGIHHLTFSYEPWTFSAGLLISLTGLVVSTSLVIYDRHRTRSAIAES